MTKRIQNIRTTILPSLMVVAMIVCGVGQSWGTDYVINYGSYYLAFNGNGSDVSATSFVPSTCIWTCTSDASAATETDLQTSSSSPYYLSLKSGTTRYFMYCPSSGNIQSSTTANKLWYIDSNYLTRYNSLNTNRTYYVYYTNNTFSWSRSNYGSTRATPYPVNIQSHDASVTPPTIKESATTLSTKGSTANFSASGSTYTPAYISYSWGSGTTASSYYSTDSGASATSGNGPSSTTPTTGVTYTWKLSNNLKDYASVDENGVVTYDDYPSSDITGSITVTATYNGITSDPSTAVSITLKANPLIQAIENIDNNIGDAPGQVKINNETNWETFKTSAQSLTTDTDIQKALSNIKDYYTINPMQKGYFRMQNVGNSCYVMAGTDNLEYAVGYGIEDVFYAENISDNVFTIKSLTQSTYAQKPEENTAVTLGTTAWNYTFTAKDIQAFNVGVSSVYLNSNGTNITGSTTDNENSRWGITMLDVYTVIINGSALPTGVNSNVDYIGTTDKLATDGYIVVPQGHIIDKSKLTTTPVEDYSYAFTVDNDAKTITLTYTKANYTDYTLKINKPSALTDDDMASVEVAVTNAKNSPFKYTSFTKDATDANIATLTIRSASTTLAVGNITASSVTKGSDTYIAHVTVNNSTRTITVDYAYDPYQYEYTLVLNNAPSGTTVTIANTKVTAGYTNSTTVLASTTEIKESDVTTSGDGIARKAILIDNTDRTITVNYTSKATEYYVEITGLTDNVYGALLSGNTRYGHGSVFDASTLKTDATADDVAAAITDGTLSAGAITNFTASVSVSGAKIIVAYSPNSSIEVTITYNVYYDGVHYATFPITAHVGDSYPHIDGTSNVDVKDADGNITAHYGDITGISYLPFGVYGALYDETGVFGTTGLIYDAYPSTMVTESRTVDLDVKYLYQYLPFYSESTRFSKITQWYAAIIGANGTLMEANNATTYKDYGSKYKNFYIYAKNGSVSVDTSTEVLNEDKYDAEDGLKISAKEPGYYWAIIGNPFKFRMLNRSIGAGKYLKFNATDDNGGGYFSFDDEGTYFTCSQNYAVPAGSYGTTTRYDLVPNGKLPMVAGACFLLYDYLYGDSTPTYFGLQYTTDADGIPQLSFSNALNYGSVASVLTDPKANIYVSSITTKDNPKDISYTVHVVVPSGDTNVQGGVMDDTNPIFDTNSISFSSEPSPDDITTIGVDGYDAVVSIDDFNRYVFVTYIKNTDFSDLYYVRNRGTWNGFFMGDDEDASATADPRHADHIYLLPAGTVSAYMNNTRVNLPSYNVYGRTSDGTVYVWNDASSSGSSGERERYILYGNDGSILNNSTTYIPQIDNSKTYMFVDVANIAEGDMYVLNFDNNPYSANGCPLVIKEHNAQVRKDGQWQFIKYEEPTAITVSCLTPNTDFTAYTTFTDGYVQWAGNNIKNGGQVYVLSGDTKSVTGLTVPILDNGTTQKRLYIKEYSYTDRTYSVVWEDTNIIPDATSLATAINNGDVFYLANANGHGLLKYDSDNEQTKLHIKGAYNIEGTEIALPDYCEPISVFNVDNVWNIEFDANDQYMLKNFSENMYVAQGDGDYPQLVTAATPLPALSFNSDGTVSFVTKQNVTSRIGVDFTDADNPVQLLASDNTDNRWYLLSPQQHYEYTIVTNIDNGGISVNTSGDEYHNSDKFAYITQLTSDNINSYLSPITLDGYSASIRYTNGDSKVYVDYVIAITDDAKYICVPSPSGSPWAAYTASIKDNVLGLAFDTSVNADGTGDKAALYSFRNLSTYGHDKETKGLTATNLYYGTKPYTADIAAGTQYSDIFADYCGSLPIDNNWYTGTIYLHGYGYFYAKDNLAENIQHVGDATTQQFGFTNDVTYADRYLFVPAREALNSTNGYDGDYANEYVIVPERSLGYVGKNPSNFVGQLSIGTNLMDGEETFNINLAPMANITRLATTDDSGNYIGAVNRRHTTPFALISAESVRDYTITISDLPSTVSSTDVIANIDGVDIYPTTTTIKNYPLDMSDIRMKPIEGYHYEVSLGTNTIDISYTVGEKVTTFDQIVMGKAYTLRSYIDKGYVTYDENWEKNPVINDTKCITLTGSWKSDYRYMTTPTDYQEGNALWGFIPVSISDDKTTMTAYMGTFASHNMITGNSKNAWGLTRDQVKPITIKKCDDGTFKLMSQKYDSDGNAIASSEFWLHAPNKGSKSYGWLSNYSFTSSEDGKFLSPYQQGLSTGRSDIIGETNEDATKWIIETTEYSNIAPQYTVTLKGLFAESEVANPLNIQISSSSEVVNANPTATTTLQSTLTASDFDGFTAKTVIEYDADYLKVTSVTPPTGYDYVSSTISGRDITITFSESFDHMLTRAKDLYKAGKKKYGEGDAVTSLTITNVANDNDTYSSGSTRVAEDSHSNIYYGYPSAEQYATLRTAINTAVASDKGNAARTTLKSAIETFYENAKSMANINVPDENTVVRLFNAGTDRRLAFTADELENGEYASWSVEANQMGQLFYLMRDTKYPSDPTRYIAYNALGHTTSVAVNSVYAMGHEEMQEGTLTDGTAAAAGHIGAFYCTNPDYNNLAMSDPYQATSSGGTGGQLYLWGLGKLNESATTGPDYKFNYLRTVDADIQYGKNAYTIYDIVVTGIPEGEAEKPINVYLRNSDGSNGTFYNGIYNGGWTPIPDTGGIGGDGTDSNPYTLLLFNAVAPEYGTYYKAKATMTIETKEKTGTDRGRITFAYTLPSDYYWNEFAAYVNNSALVELNNNSILTYDKSSTAGLFASTVAEKGYGYPVNSVNETFRDEIVAMGNVLQNYNKDPGTDELRDLDVNDKYNYNDNATYTRSQFTYDVYLTQKAILDGYVSDYLNTTDVKMPEAGDIIGIMGVVDSGSSAVYNVGTKSSLNYIVEDCKYNSTTPIPVDATVASVSGVDYSFNYDNNHFWIVEDGTTSGSVAFRSAYCDGTYSSWTRTMETTPKEWYFTRGTELGYLSIYFRYDNGVGRYAATTSGHDMYANGEKTHTTTLSTDFIITDAKCDLYTFKIITPSSYTGTAPKVILKASNFVAYSPLADGGQMTFPSDSIISTDPVTTLTGVPVYTEDVLNTYFTAQVLPGYTASSKIDLKKKTVTVTYTENVSTVKIRANEWLSNLKRVTAVWGTDSTSTSSPYVIAYNAVNKSDATTEDIYAAMKTFYQSATGKTFTLVNEASGQYLGTVNGSQKGGGYLGTSTSTDTESQYQLMYDGDGTEPKFRLYNIGYGNYVGKTISATSRMTSSTTAENAGYYTMTVIQHSSGQTNHFYLTCQNGSLGATNSVITESTDVHSLLANKESNDTKQHWTMTSVTSTLPVPGNYYYVQNGSTYIYQSSSNGGSYTENTSSNANNPAAIFTISRSGSKYIIQNMAGGYLNIATDGTVSVSSTAQKLTAAQIDDLTFSEVTVKNDSYSELLELYYTASQYPIGTTVGTYANGTPSLTTDTSTGKAAARTALNETPTEDNVTALQSAIDALTLNMPSSTFYRIKSKSSGTYLTMEDGVNEANMKLKGYSEAVDDMNKNAYPIFWLQDRDQTETDATKVYKDDDDNLQFKILGYSNGQYMQNTFLLTSAAYQTSASKFTFEEGNSIGCYAIKSDVADHSIVYLSASANSLQVSSKSEKTTVETDWILEPVTILPVTVGVTGYATLHLPVRATIPSGLTVGYGSEIKTSTSKTGAIGEVTLQTVPTTLPAFTPVVLFNSGDSPDANGDYTPKVFLFDLSNPAAADTPANMVLKGTYSTQTQADWFKTYLDSNKNPVYSDVYVLMRGKVTVGGSTTYPVGFFGDYIGELSGFKAVLPKKGTGDSSSFGAAKGFVFHWEGLDDSDAIAPVSCDQLQDSDAPIYNLGGMYVGNNRKYLPRGIYIQEGRKIVIK